MGGVIREWLAMPDDEFGVRSLPAVAEFRSRLAHDNPRWVVASPANARKALDLHGDCDFSRCSTLVAAVIVSREDYRYFRRIEANGAGSCCAPPTLGSGA
ncbi:hypothetical protein [Nocardia araoensis]|uniref:hypothetical protein n=1 Tax=Nocardia araoensis TaxID=228600 RepID=UPI0002EEDFB9|nr:hypothetical protein [Nocardia araoensis]